MNAVEKIEAAIAKLERLRSWGNEDEWRAGPDHWSGTTITNKVGRFMAHNVPSPTADLIVTLHRTIDAQLAILRSVLLARNIEQNWATLVYTTDALALADAILGGDS